MDAKAPRLEHDRPAARFRHRADGPRSHARLLPRFRLHPRSYASRAHARLALRHALAHPFVRSEKYPPSLLFVLITLGVSLLCLLAFQRLRGLLARVLLAYGRTPLFTDVLHIYVVHGASLVVALLAGYPAAYHVNFLMDPFRLYQAGFGS